MASIRNYSVALFSLLIIFGVSASTFTFTQTAPRKAVYVSYGEAQPVLNALRDILPSTLKGKSVDELGVLWPNWIRTRDAEIRARLALGDEDSLVNLLLRSRNPIIPNPRAWNLKHQRSGTFFRHAPTI